MCLAQCCTAWSGSAEGLSPGLAELIRSALPTEFTTPTVCPSHSTTPRLEARRDGHMLGLCSDPGLASSLSRLPPPPSFPYSLWTPPVSSARATQS